MLDRNKVHPIHQLIDVELFGKKVRMLEIIN